MELLVTKRNGEPVDYDENKIVIAIAKAGKATKEFDKTDAVKLANQVSMEIDIRNITVISVETIQDIVEDTLLYIKTNTKDLDNWLINISTN